MARREELTDEQWILIEPLPAGAVAVSCANPKADDFHGTFSELSESIFCWLRGGVRVATGTLVPERKREERKQGGPIRGRWTPKPMWSLPLRSDAGRRPTLPRPSRARGRRVTA